MVCNQVVFFLFYHNMSSQDKSLQSFTHNFINVANCIILGFPKDRDLGDCKYMPAMRYTDMNKLSVISVEANHEVSQNIGEILPFVENSDNHKILYLLLLTDIQDNATCIRLRAAILSMIFHLESDGTQSEIDILAPYLEMVSRMNKNYTLRKALFDQIAPF